MERHRPPPSLRNLSFLGPLGARRKGKPAKLPQQWSAEVLKEIRGSKGAGKVGAEQVAGIPEPVLRVRPKPHLRHCEAWQMANGLVTRATRYRAAPSPRGPAGPQARS